MGLPVCKDTWHDGRENEEGVGYMIDRIRLIEALTVIAFSDIRNYLDLGPDGLKAKSLAEIDTMKLHALKKYRVNQTRRSFCIQLHDKGKALTMLLKITGRLRSRMDLTNGF